jgi:hypothetical protein
MPTCFCCNADLIFNIKKSQNKYKVILEKSKKEKEKKCAKQRK